MNQPCPFWLRHQCNSSQEISWNTLSHIVDDHHKLSALLQAKVEKKPETNQKKYCIKNTAFPFIHSTITQTIMDRLIVYKMDGPTTKQSFLLCLNRNNISQYWKLQSLWKTIEQKSAVGICNVFLTRYPSCPVSTGLQFSSTISGFIPKNGNEAEPGFIGVQPGSDVMVWPPVSVCQNVSTMEHFPSPTTL